MAPLQESWGGEGRVGGFWLSSFAGIKSSVGINLQVL